MVSTRIIKLVIGTAFSGILLASSQVVFAAPPPPSPVPEPGTWAMLGSFVVAAGGYVALRRRSGK